MASEAAQRVQEALAARGAACRVVELPARTPVFAITPAELVAVTGGQVARVGRSPA